MKHTIEAIEKSQVKITVSLEKNEWQEMNVLAYNKNKGKYSLQGFRKGKVPMSVLKNAYGEGVFYEEAVNLALTKYYFEVLDQNQDIFPVAQPDVDITEIDENGLTFVAIVPVKPEVVLGEYKGIKFEKTEYNVKDEDVDEVIKRMQDNAGRMVDVDDRDAQDGDYANIDFEGSVDGVVFDGGSAQGYDLVLGSHSFIPGFEEGVVGMKIGEEKVIPVVFPENYGEPTLAGKPADFKVKLNSLRVKELPELDDEFAKDVSEFDTLEELRNSEKEKLAKQNEERAEFELEDKIIAHITENATVELPDAMIEGQIDNMLQDFEYRLMYQGMNLDAYLKYQNITREDFRANFRADAEKNCKSQLVIDKIIKSEDIKPTEEEMEAEMKVAAERLKKDFEEYKKNVSEEQKDYLSRNIIIKKLFDFLKNSNEITTVKE